MPRRMLAWPLAAGACALAWRCVVQTGFVLGRAPRLRSRSSASSVTRSGYVGLNDFIRKKTENPKPIMGKSFEHRRNSRDQMRPRGERTYTSSEENDARVGGPGRDGGNFDWTRELAACESLWTSLFEEPAEWDDCRLLKESGALSPRSPDFRHRGVGGEVWLDGFFLPSWVPERLQEADTNGSPWRPRTEQDLVEADWRQLFDKPQEWRDFRAMKLSGKVESTHADFVQLSGDLILSLGDARVPEWVAAELQKADDSGDVVWRIALSRHEDQWLRLFVEPESWLDHRSLKADRLLRPAHPDFTNQRTQERLWIDMQNFGWVDAKLQAADESAERFWPQAAPRVEA